MNHAQNSHIRELQRQLREGGVTDQWRTVGTITKALRRSDDSAVFYRLKEMVRAGEAECTKFVNKKSGRVANYFRRKIT